MEINIAEFMTDEQKKKIQSKIDEIIDSIDVNAIQIKLNKELSEYSEELAAVIKKELSENAYGISEGIADNLNYDSISKVLGTQIKTMLKK